ncbi:MAG: SDR family oxidoreductase [Acidobacteriota bacterium]
MTKPHVLLTGVTGYVGGRLRRRFEESGIPLRCMTRNARYLAPRVAETTEVVEGDILDRRSLESALTDIDTAYYLIHAMGASGDFEELDRQGAENFAAAARSAGLRKIIYLGGLGRGPGLSAHLLSRQNVGRILRDSGIPTVELRSSIIIGSGSLSFEMIRSLVEKLPVMITPRWVRIASQPIAVEDVLDYLVQAADPRFRQSEIYEIGGPDRVSYGAIMREYARQKGLRRWILPVPLLSLRLSSLWLGLVTPIYARIGRKLVEGVRNETVVSDDRALRDFSVRPRGIEQAIRRALANEDQSLAETRWSDALSSLGTTSGYGGLSFGSRFVDSRSITVPVSRTDAFRPIRRIGGSTGWYYGNWLWELRGFIDLLMGGPGIRRGRRDPDGLAVGDTLDFWRVEAFEPDRLLRLQAEMKVPGRAWLQFEVTDEGEAKSSIRQTAIFEPLGLSGRLYWYAAFPLHQFVFRGMLDAIARRAVAGSSICAQGPPSPRGTESTDD